MFPIETQTFLPENINTWLQNIENPSLPSLNDAYDTILSMNSKRSKRAAALARKALSWMLCAQRPLKSEELIAAISVDSDWHHSALSKDDILSICSNMVVLDVLDEFRFAHLSVREYLELQEDYSLVKTNTLALERCLDVYLIELSTRTESAIEQNNIFQRYADVYWPLHYRTVQDSQREVGIPMKLQQFLFQHSDGLLFEKWISMIDKSLAKILNGDLSLRRKLQAMFSTPQTPFFLACSFGLTSILDELRRRTTINWNQRNNNEDTGLHVAAANGQEAVVRFLLEKGVQIEAKGAHGSTALHQAAENNQETEISILLQKGANIEALMDGDETPLLCAVEKGSEAAVFILLENGAQANATLKDGFSALWLAADGSHEEIVKLLIEGGASVDVLHAAAKRGTENIARQLLDQGADINQQDKNGQTALHIAVENAQDAVTTFLLRRGADLTIKDGNGKTALDLARSDRHESIREIFQKRPPIDGPIVDKRGISGQQDDLQLPKQPLLSIGRTVCREVRATVVDFFKAGQEYHFVEKPSVFSLLYGDGPEILMQRVTGSMEDIRAERTCRWCHLPANNVCVTPVSI